MLENYPNIKQMFRCWSFFMIMIGSVWIGAFGELALTGNLLTLIWFVCTLVIITMVWESFYHLALWQSLFRERAEGKE